MNNELTIENLKCCGNCKKGRSIPVVKDISFFCIPADEVTDPGDCCHLWEFDNTLYAERDNKMFKGYKE